MVIAFFADATGLNNEASRVGTRRTLQEKFSEADGLFDIVTAIITVVIDTGINILTLSYPVHLLVKLVLFVPLIVAFFASVKGALGGVGAILALVGL